MSDPLIRMLDRTATPTRSMDPRISLPEWHLEAACRGMDTRVFFPERGDDATEARTVCRTCPVQRDCLTWAVENNPRFGVWGGTSYDDRRDIRRGR